MTAADTQLGRQLMTLRGMQFLHAHSGDPYAVTLRAEDEDLSDLKTAIRHRGPVHRSRTGTWVVSDRELGEQILSDPRFSTELPSGHVLEGVYPFCEAEWSAPTLTGSVLLDGHGAQFDLVRDVLRPSVARLAAELMNVPAQSLPTYIECVSAAGPAVDALLCPPRLVDARTILAAVDALRAILPNNAAGFSILGVELTVTLAAEAVNVLLADPSQWQALSANPAVAGGVLDRILTERPPMRLDRRVSREPVRLGDEWTAEGDEVVVHVGAAGIGLRGLPQVAAFVSDAATALLTALAVRFPTLRFDGPVARRLRAPVTGALVRMPVAVPNSVTTE